jgi:nicotinate-nucleotide adenylyltransferase
MTGQRVGILGGSFNPVHNGHLILAQDALEKFELDQVLFVPCYVPVHKDPSGLLPFDQRYAMLESVVETDLQFDLSPIERDRGGASYAIDTVTELQARQPGVEYSFIIGADSLCELHTWHRIYDMLQQCRILVMCRPGFCCAESLRAAIRLDEPWPDRLLENLARAHEVEISSTDIRMRVAEGMRISYLVPPSVEMYIAEHNLYRS